MVDDLRRAVELAERRSDEEQRVLAQVLLEALGAEERWSALFDDPRSAQLLDRLATEALAADDAGETEEIRGDSFG